MTALAFDTDTATLDELRDAALRAPLYAKALRRSIRFVHGVPRLHTSTDLGNVEIYIGRSFAGGVKARFRDGWSRRGHRHGAVCFRCPTRDVMSVEKLGIRLLDRLRTEKKLCVGNASLTAAGSLPSTKHAVVYITWRVIGRRRAVGRPTPTEVRELSRALAVDPGLEFGRSTIQAGLQDLTRPKTGYASLSWHEGA